MVQGAEFWRQGHLPTNSSFATYYLGNFSVPHFSYMQGGTGNFCSLKVLLCGVRDNAH